MLERKRRNQISRILAGDEKGRRKRLSELQHVFRISLPSPHYFLTSVSLFPASLSAFSRFLSSYHLRSLDRSLPFSSSLSLRSPSTFPPSLLLPCSGERPLLLSLRTPPTCQNPSEPSLANHYPGI